ncbi:MAG: S49 family peptidase [bacterium]
MMKKRTAVILIVVAIVATYAVIMWAYYGDPSWSSSSDTASSTEIPADCNVLAFNLNGEIATYLPQDSISETDSVSSADILDGLKLAKENPQIKAVLLSVDSGGGSVVAGEEIANGFKALGKPSAAVIRDLGASAAYWAATGAGRIFASKVSDVGSIGITASYLDNTVANAKDGLTPVAIVSAPYKNEGDPDFPLTAAGKADILASIKKDHEVFVDEVAANRKLDRSKVAALADGRTYVGTDAVDNGLIDGIGSIPEATDYLTQQIGESAQVCWY